MSQLSDHLHAQLSAYPHIRRWVVAFSGGLDSSVLLHCAATLLPPERLRAIHINHQLQPAARYWVDHCLAQAGSLGVVLDVVSVTPDSASEADARAARYRVFEQLGPDEGLLMAHHADDQAETFLHRLMRGAGVSGLSAMPEQRPLGAGLLLRPFLSLRRSQLEAYADQSRLQWVEDPSNAQLHYQRNFLRQRVLPLLQSRWPTLVPRLLRTVDTMQETRQLLQEVAESDLAACQLEGGGLSLRALRGLSPARRNNLLRYWSGKFGVILTAVQLQQLCKQMLDAGGRGNAHLALAQRGEFRAYRGRLWWLPESACPPARSWHGSLYGGQTLDLGAGSLQVSGAANDTVMVEVAFRQGGERLRPLGRGGSVSLKQLLQERGIPPWLRDTWPLLYMDGVLVAVPGVCVTEDWPQTCTLTLSWQPLSLSAPPFFANL